MSQTSSSRLPGGFDALSHARVTDDANLKDGLLRVAQAGCTVLDNCWAASVTIIERDRPITAACTDPLAEALDVVQYEADDGPCLAAAREERLIRVDHTSADDRWPKFASAASEHGVLSSLSVPLVLAGEDHAGGLNIYSRVPAAFGTQDERLALAFAAQASAVVSNVQAYWAAFEMTRNLTLAMESRAVIEQAKGVLIGRHGLAGDDAFDMLRQRSQQENRKLREIASELVAEAADCRERNDE